MITKLWIGSALTGCLALGDTINAHESQSPHLYWLAGGHPFGAAAVQFLADGQLLSAGAGLKRWDVLARRLKRTLSTPRVGEDVIALGPGGAWVATVSLHPDRALILRELSEGRELQRLPLAAANLPPTFLSASPEGEWLLGAAGDGRVFRWHVPSGQALPTLHIHVLRPQAPGGWWGTLVTSNEFVATDFKGVFRARLEPPALLWERTADTSQGSVLNADRRWMAFGETNRVLVLDALTGEVVWRALEDEGGMWGSVFSSPAIATLAGQQQLLVQTRTTLAGLDLDSGQVFWRQEVEAFRGMNILTPVVFNNHVCTSTYGGKTIAFHVTREGDQWRVAPAWSLKQQGYMSTPVVIGGHAYHHLRSQRLTCLDLVAGVERWTSTQSFGKYMSLVARRGPQQPLDVSAVGIQPHETRAGFSEAFHLFEDVRVGGGRPGRDCARWHRR